MMGDNKAQKQQPQSMNTNPWGGNNNPAWQCGPQMGFYGNQGGAPFGQNMGYQNPFLQYFNSQQQQIAFTNANNALMQNGIHNQLTGFIPQVANNAMNQCSSGDKSNMNVLPPLPPGPPPPLNSQKFEPPPPPGTSNSNNNNGSYYGQPQNTAYPPITFNLNNKKTGLGFQPMLNNSGAGKKKRRKNKNQMQQMNGSQFGNTFMSAGTGNTYSQQPPPPPLPPTLPPPFPPLPPLPVEPPATPPGNKSMTQPDVQIISGPKVEMGNQPRYKSPLLPAVVQPKNNWAGLTTSEPWPDSLKAYVNRCYSKCVEDVDKDQVEIILKGKITSSANEGSLWIKNWDLELLPSLYSERKTIEIKKPLLPSPSASDLLPKQSPVQRGPPNFSGAKRGRGLSASMGSRLGGFGRGRRSRSRSFSPGGKTRRRSRSRDDSRSPSRRRKERRSSGSSSSSEENFKPLMPATKKKRGGGAAVNRAAANLNKTLPMSKKAKRRMKMDEKAKSHFYSEFGTAGREPINTERLQKRADRFKGTLKSASPPVTPVAGRGRKRPFSLGVPTLAADNIDTISDVDWRNFHIVGTCREVDKQYLRQTTAPDASTIRPMEVLQKALVAVQERWKKDSDYFFACDRMKSIRLDLTLQGIRNEFTVKVYETHARIALEKGDHQELNQCLSQLTQLYAEVNNGRGSANRLEFTAYGILYYVFTKDTLELTTLLGRLTEADKADPCVAHAIGIRTAWLTCNYNRFFRLYKDAPRMAGYAVELFLERERIAALKVMIKAYRPSLPVCHVAKELAFENVTTCLEFLTPFELVYADPLRTKIDCKSSVSIIVTK